MQYFLFDEKPTINTHCLVFKKILQVMKASLFMLLVFVASVHAEGMAQNITLSLKNASIEQVFVEIKKQTDYRFLYKDEVVKRVAPVTIQLRDATIYEVLDRIVSGNNLKYRLIAGTVTITAETPASGESVEQPKKQDEVIVSGTVTDEKGTPLAQASVVVKGVSGKGTNTDVDGKFTLSVPKGATLVASYIGYQPQEFPAQSGTPVVVRLVLDESELGEVVVTALGISREKRSLGYASQEVSGEEASTVRSGNVSNALSGKVSGLNIKRNTNIGGSTNVTIRGNNSLTGNNQVLWVVDGVPVSNTTFNTEEQQSGSGSYDYGNLASDINPDDIESMNVLKGAAATALYGSRAANGAIIITTKSGSGKKGKVDVNLNSDFTTGFIDKSAFPKFQNQYGGGYSPIAGASGDGYFVREDFDGDGEIDMVVPFLQYASYGAAFDPDLMVFHWNAVDEESPYYMQKRPWVAAENGPITFFENYLNSSNNLSVAGESEMMNYRLSYTNYFEDGILPNSELKRNNFSLNARLKVNDRLSVGGSANYVVTDALGRNVTGYSSEQVNDMSVFKQYWQTNVDVKELRDIYFKTKRSVKHFPGGGLDNPYWVRYENYSTDSRNRFFGNTQVNYRFADWLNFEGRISVDTYSYLQEERINNHSRNVSRYVRRDINFTELNYDLMLNFNKTFGSDFNLFGVLGTNFRREDLRSISASTNGGIIIDRLYAISNSVNVPLAPIEVAERIGVNSAYGLASVGYKNMLFVDLTGRVDHSSTLPVDNSSYFYPSVATSFVFSELLDKQLISFGKIRINYAQVGNSAPANSLTDVLVKPAPYGSIPIYEGNGVKANNTLKPESTTSVETGLEMSFLNSRVGFDLSFYQTNTKDQIMPVAVSSTTGYSSKFVNAGEIRNAGVELSAHGSPIKNENFEWSVNVNWSRNRNKVLSLFEDIDNLLLTTVSGVSLNATVGQPYGTLQGTDFVYLDGKRVINQTDGSYMRTTTANNVIGNMNPDWNGGLSNRFRYKNFNLSFLFDVQQGGDIYLADMPLGARSGLYANSVGINDLGNPIRNTLENGGGIILDGVTPDGAVNTVRTSMHDYNHALGSLKAPDALFIYDASYVKLRELTLAYTIPAKVLNRISLAGAQVALIGSNLWILSKNVIYNDPEAGIGAGNYQGFIFNALPSTRNISLSLKLQF